MKILLVGSFLHPMYAPAFKIGFIKMGHDVRCIKYEDYLYGGGLVGNFFTRLQNRYHLGYKVWKYNLDIINAVHAYHPDLVFLYRCHNVWGSTAKKIKSKNIILFTYHNDDPFSGIPSEHFYTNYKSIIRFADMNFVYRGKNLDDFKRMGIDNVRVLLPYYLEESNFYIDCKDVIPIAFLGHFENDGRDRLILALKQAGLLVTVYNGSDWENAPLYNQIKDVVKPGLRGAQYNMKINECQIALVFLSKINSDTYTRRCFEIPATKTLMLCEYTADMDRMFPADECAVYYKSEDELVEKCKYLLSNPEVIERVAEKGYERLKEIGGSEVDRCSEVLEVFNSIKNKDKNI